MLFKLVAVFHQYGLSIQSLIETSLLNLPNLPGVRVVGTFQSFYTERIIIVCFFTVCEQNTELSQIATGVRGAYYVNNPPVIFLSLFWVLSSFLSDPGKPGVRMSVRPFMMFLKLN